MVSHILDRRASCILPRYRTASREARVRLRLHHLPTVADALDRLCANLDALPDAGRTLAGSVLTTDDLDTLLHGITLLPCAVGDLVRTLGTLGWGEAEAEKALRQRVAGAVPADGPPAQIAELLDQHAPTWRLGSTVPRAVVRLIAAEVGTRPGPVIAAISAGRNAYRRVRPARETYCQQPKEQGAERMPAGPRCPRPRGGHGPGRGGSADLATVSPAHGLGAGDAHAPHAPDGGGVGALAGGGGGGMSEKLKAGDLIARLEALERVAQAAVAVARVAEEPALDARDDVLWDALAALRATGWEPKP